MDGYIDVKITDDVNMIFIEKTLGPIKQETNPFTIGPFQSDGFRLSFCSNKKLSPGTRESNRNKEWPRGNYAIFAQEKFICPEGQNLIMSVMLLQPVSVRPCVHTFRASLCPHFQI